MPTDQDEIAGPSVARTAPDMAAEQMARYGIVRVPADQFHYREYRYALLSDAVAQAERDGVRSKLAEEE